MKGNEGSKRSRLQLCLHHRVFYYDSCLPIIHRILCLASMITKKMGLGYSEHPEVDIFLDHICVGRGVRAVKGAFTFGCKCLQRSEGTYKGKPKPETKSLNDPIATGFSVSGNQNYPNKTTHTRNFSERLTHMTLLKNLLLCFLESRMA